MRVPSAAEYNCHVATGIDLIGRDDELDRMERFLDGLGPGALALRGEAGVGKTALTDEVVRRAAARGWRVLRVIGVEAEETFTLGGLNQMVIGLRPEFEGLDDHDREVLAPVFGADPPTSPSPVALAMALRNLLAASARPILLLVDDVHWLDDVSASVLSVAGRRAVPPQVRIVASFRPHQGFSSAGWTEVTLGPLGVAEAARLLDGMTMSLSANRRRAILEVAAGNPLALEELPRHADHIEAWTTALPLTDRLVTVFGGRLMRLAPRERVELLRAALDGVRANSAADTGARYQMVDVQAAIDEHLLVVDPLGDIVFRHPLVRAAVIHQASAAQRREAHTQLATLYEDVLVRRANHLGEATAEPDQDVADLLDEAARLSIRRGGAAVAVDWLRRAAELSVDRFRRDALRADAAFVAAQASRFDDAQALADEVGWGEESAASVLTTAYVELYRDGEVAHAHRRIVRALRDADALDDGTLTRLVTLAITLSMYAGDAGMWGQTDEVVDRFAHRVDAVTLLYRDAWGDVARRGQTVRVRLDEHLDGLETLEPWGVMRLAVAAFYVDALADFRATLNRLFDRERERGAVTNAMTMLHLLLLDQIGSGRWVQAQESVQRGLELTDAHRNELFRCQFVAYAGFLAACAGDVQTARRRASEVTAWAGPRRLGLLLDFAQRIPVLVALAEADYDTAHAAAVRISPAGRFPSYAHDAVHGLFDFVEAAVHAGHAEDGRVHVEAARRLGLGEISPRLDALCTAAAAMTAADADAGVLYATAADHPGITDFPFEHNRIRLAYGMWLRRQRRTGEAREQLGLSADGFDALGATPWADRARTELRAAGAGIKRDRSGVALTAQERAIADMAAAGRSNKQIAAQLYLSPRTVGAHLYRIFPKLGVTSRAGLGQALRELSRDEG